MASMCNRSVRAFSRLSNSSNLPLLRILAPYSPEKLHRQQNYLYSSCSNTSINSLKCEFHNYNSHRISNVRFNSSSTNPDLPTDYIPPIPEIKSIVEKGLENNLLEPDFVSQGLGGWTPVGLLQNAFEMLHVDLGMPWWSTIVAGTIVVRICLFPLIIKSQQMAGKMNNHLPQMQVLQKNMMDARKSGDQILALRAANELSAFMKEKDINPLKQMLVPLCQAPVFISFFMSLRQMANLPVESMKTGGLFWFTDLTIADPYYITPIITSATLYLTIELGVDGARADSLGLMKYVIRAMPLFIFPFTLNFPAAILCYWMTSNFMSLCQVAILKVPSVRTYFKIPSVVKHDKTALPMSKDGFVKSVKDNFRNQRLIKDMEDRHRIEDVKFRKAGIGPLQKTYKYDPTKQVPKSSK